MYNILDYLKWRGDLTFAQDELNEVDNLILSTLAYIEFDGIVRFEKGSERIFLSEIADRAYDAIDFDSPRGKNLFFVQTTRLLKEAAATVRFGSLELSRYINRIDQDNSEQFSAVVFSINDHLHYIAFRGTDDLLVGWKEDFQMSFLDEVQAQKDAVAYVRFIIDSLEGNIYLGGHSKGGNLAVYTAASLKHAYKRIVAVYNNDGPGFQEKFLNSPGYHRMLPKIHTIVPKSSVVGILMEHLEEYVIVNSNQKGIGGHSSFSWEVMGNHFVYKPGLMKSSILLNRTLRQWLSKITVEERAAFVEELFEILYASGLITVSGISEDKLAAANNMLKAYKNMKPDAKRMMRRLIYLFIDEGQKAFFSSLEEDIGSLRIGNKRIINHQMKGYITLKSPGD